MKYLMILMLSMLLLTFVSGNGLSIINLTTADVNKVYNQDLTFNFKLYNNDSISFYNISFETNGVIQMPKIDTLVSGQIADVNAIINTNENFKDKIRIKAFYIAQLGITNTTHEVEIDYNNGLSKCDFSITKGDSINFINKVLDEITIRNAETGINVATILMGQNYTTFFEQPGYLKYYVLRRGLVFTNICLITALDDNGLINNPEYDTFLNLNITIMYNPTKINISVLEKNYSVNAFASQDGILTLTNNGNETAKAISLKAEWFSFSANNFDLLPGQTKGIIYTIKPILTKTEETNKSYIKLLEVKGNFLTLQENFNIFIPYLNIGSGNFTSNYESFLNLFKQFCLQYPQESFCKDTPNVVYIGNSSDSVFNVTYSQEQVKQLYEYMFKKGDEQQINQNIIKAQLDDLSNSTILINEMKDIITKMQDEKDKDKTFNLILLFVVIFIALSCVIVILIFLKKKRTNLKKLDNWSGYG